MTVAINEVLRVTLEFESPNASTQYNVFTYSMQTQASDESDVVDELEAFFGTTWKGAWALLGSDEVTFVGGQVAVMNLDGTVNRNIGSFLVNALGAVGTQVVSAAESAYMLAYTDLPKTRGSKYIPGMGESSVDSGQLSTAAQGYLAAMLVLYLATINMASGGKLVPGVLSKTLLAYKPFNASGIIESIPAYQRRRKPGVGI